MPLTRADFASNLVNMALPDIDELAEEFTVSSTDLTTRNNMKNCKDHDKDDDDGSPAHVMDAQFLVIPLQDVEHPGTV